MFSPLKNLVSFVNLIFDYVLVKFFFTTYWLATIVIRIPLVRPMLHPNVSSTTVVFHFFSVQFSPLLIFLLHTINPNIQGFELSKKYFYCVRESKPNILQSWMSNIHTYVYSVGEENRAIVEPEIQGSKILEQGLEHLMQEACFLSAQPTRETYIYAR